jgi:hypothetical protein
MPKAKTYPLDVRSVGDDTYIVMSKGHHEPDVFMAAVREAGYDWPLGQPQHKWVSVSPCGRSCGEHNCHYNLYDEHHPGRFPATYAWEDYGKDRYQTPAGVSASDGQTFPRMPQALDSRANP